MKDLDGNELFIELIEVGDETYIQVLASACPPSRRKLKFKLNSQMAGNFAQMILRRTAWLKTKKAGMSYHLRPRKPRKAR